ncbi:MAG: hypothetical protein IT328_06020 [Caldilineaceae bacterium]|nr:hypothetical protein [Caldilineaceae bacterium]
MTDPYKQQVQTWRAYAPGVDEVMSPPQAPIEIEAQEASPNSQQTQAGLIVIVSANLAMTAIIICAMLFDGRQVEAALQRGILYFALTTPLFLIIITGSLSKILGRWSREKTERQRIKAYERVMVVAFQWRQAVESNRAAELQAQALPTQLTRRIAALETELLERSVSAGGVQPPSTFVSPHDNRSNAAFAAETEPQVDTTANEAISWASGLYNELGQADPTKVQADGRLKVRMIGSSRGPGSREAGLWLIQKGVIVKVPGGFALNMRHFRTRESLRNLF